MTTTGGPNPHDELSGFLEQAEEGERPEEAAEAASLDRGRPRRPPGDGRNKPANKGFTPQGGRVYTKQQRRNRGPIDHWYLDDIVRITSDRQTSKNLVDAAAQRGGLRRLIRVYFFTGIVSVPDQGRRLTLAELRGQTGAKMSKENFLGVVGSLPVVRHKIEEQVIEEGEDE